MFKFEGHMTFKADVPETALKEVGKTHRFHYSEITGWDETGIGIKRFLTGHDESPRELLNRMHACASDLRHRNVHAIRIKVELCLHDERY